MVAGLQTSTHDTIFDYDVSQGNKLLVFFSGFVRLSHFSEVEGRIYKMNIANCVV